jgi:hypothetical protein
LLSDGRRKRAMRRRRGGRRGEKVSMRIGYNIIIVAIIIISASAVKRARSPSAGVEPAGGEYSRICCIRITASQ